MPVFIQKLIIFSRFFGIPAARNHWNLSLVVNRFYEFFAVITFVCNDITVLQTEGHHQVFDRFVITDLTTCQINFNRNIRRIDYGMDLGGISTLRTTNLLLFRLPFPPTPYWCTRIYVPSIINSSSSMSRVKFKMIFSHNPRFVHLEYRLYTLLHEPNRSGKSYHGAPVFSIQMIALIIIRLPLAGRPFPSKRSGGIKSLICFHYSSVISCLFIIPISMPDAETILISVVLLVFNFYRHPLDFCNTIL